jgi:hypothetical protein
MGRTLVVRGVDMGTTALRIGPASRRKLNVPSRVDEYE